MASFLPSEISRLVLGYLEEVNCMTAYDEFLKNCPNLQECRGRHFDTRVMGNTLINILKDYSKAEAEMYYNKNKELQRLLRQRWSLVQRMRFLVENVDMCKVRQYSSNNSPYPFSTPQRADNIRKLKLCPQCKDSDHCSCTRGGVVSPALSDLFAEPVNVDPVQSAVGSVPIESLVEATPLSQLPGTSSQYKEELTTSSNTRSCSKSKDERAQLSHDSGVTNVSQKSLDRFGQNDNCPLTQDKEVIVTVNSEHNMSIDLSMKENVLLECSEAASHSEGRKENCAGNSSGDSASIVPGQISAKENNNSFKEFLSGVAVQYDNETSEVIRESSTPDLILQRRLSSCATKIKPPNKTDTTSKVISPQITKEPALESKTIKTLLPRNAPLPHNCEENNYAERVQAKPPDEKNTTKIYETKPNLMSTHDPDSNEMITLYGTDTKEYATLQTIDISSFYHQTNTVSNLKNTHNKQSFPPKPAHNEKKVIILSNEIVEPKMISCNKKPPNTIQETNYGTYNTMEIADKKAGVHYRSNSDSAYLNTAAVTHDNNRGIFNVKENKHGFQQTSNETVKILDPAVSQRLQAQICSTQSTEGGKATVLAGKLPELIISNGQVQLGQLQGKILDESKYYSEKEIMSMPTLIMLHSQTSSADNASHYNGTSASSVSFMAQELPPLQTTGKPQSIVHSHIPTQPVQTKPNLSNYTKTTTLQTKTDTQTKIDSAEVHVDLTDVATPHTNPDVKKSSSTPRRQNSHIRVLDFNTPSREISSETKASTQPKNVQATPISASRTKRRAKSNLFDIKEFGDDENKSGLVEVINTQANKEKHNNFDARSVTGQASEKSLVKFNVKNVERNAPIVKSKAEKSKAEKIGINDITETVLGLKEWQAIRRREVCWDADLRASAAMDAAPAITVPPKSKPSRRKIKPKNKTDSKSLNADGKELNTSSENNANLLELALSADSKAKKKKPPAPRKKNPPKKKKDRNAVDNVSEHGNASCENKNPLPQTNIANEIVNPMKKPIEGNNKTIVQDTSMCKMYTNDDAPTKPSLQNHCIINDIGSITTVPGAKQALDKNIISINVGHYVNENVLRENNNPNNTSTNNLQTKSENFLQRDNIEKVGNVSSDKDNIESPLLPYDIISPDVQFLIPSSAMRNLSSLLETPLKMSLDMPMMTPRFMSPGSLIDPMSVLKHLEIPTPNFSNTPKTNLHGKTATPSSYVSRPTDYSSGSSYYKPDDHEYRIDVAAAEDIYQNTNQEVFVVPESQKINDMINKQSNNDTCKGDTEEENKSSSKNQYLLKSLEISLEKVEAENNATPEQRSTRPRRTCTLKNLPRPKSPHVNEKLIKKISKSKKTPNATSTESGHEDSSSSDSYSSSSSEESSDSSSLSPSPTTQIPQSSTPKEMESRKVDLLGNSQKSRDNHYTLTPQSKGKMSLQERVARSMEEKRKRTIMKLSKSQKVSPKKLPARPRVRKPPANKKKSVTKKPLLNQSVNLCIRRDSTKPVSVTRTVFQGKKVATNLAKESYQPTVLHKVPCLTKSRRKSSTPRKLQSSRVETESESHLSASAIEINASTLNNDKANIAEKEDTQPLSNSEHSTENSRIVTERLTKYKMLPSENIRSSVKRDDSVDDIMQIKDYIAESAKCDALPLPLDIRQSNHYESAKRIESDLSDPTSETKEMPSPNKGLYSVSKENKDTNEIEGNANEHNKSKQSTCDNQESKEVEEQPEKELSDDEDVVEWTNTESGPGKSNYFCVSYSGIPPTNQFPRNSKFNPDTFCMSASIIVAETGAEDVRQMKVSPIVTIVNIAPSKIKSKSSKHVSRSKTKGTTEKSKKKEKNDNIIKPIKKSVMASTPPCTISPPPKNLECLEKFEQINDDVSQMETLLAVQSIVQMDTLYTPDKSRMQLTDLQETGTKNNSLSHRINHQQPSDDQLCESIRKELERRKQRQIMKDIGLTDSSDGETSDSEQSRKAVVEPGSCRKRRHISKTHHEEPPDKKCKPSGSKLDPQTFLKTMGIESVLSKIHGPSN